MHVVYIDIQLDKSLEMKNHKDYYCIIHALILKNNQIFFYKRAEIFISNFIRKTLNCHIKYCHIIHALTQKT